MAELKLGHPKSEYFQFRIVSKAANHGLAHVKLLASSMLPEPLYFATCGYGHSGRVRITLSSTKREPMMWSGGTAFSTHSTTGVSASNVLTPTPPLKKKRAKKKKRKKNSWVGAPFWPSFF